MTNMLPNLVYSEDKKLTNNKKIIEMRQMEFPSAPPVQQIPPAVAHNAPISETPTTSTQQQNSTTNTIDKQVPLIQRNNGSQINQTLFSSYFYPTIIIIPLIIASILILVSNMSISIKIISIVLLLLTLIFYICQVRNVNILEKLKFGRNNSNTRIITPNRK